MEATHGDTDLFLVFALLSAYDSIETTRKALRNQRSRTNLSLSLSGLRELRSIGVENDSLKIIFLVFHQSWEENILINSCTVRAADEVRCDRSTQSRNVVPEIMLLHLPQVNSVVLCFFSFFPFFPRNWSSRVYILCNASVLVSFSFESSIQASKARAMADCRFLGYFLVP